MSMKPILEKLNVGIEIFPVAPPPIKAKRIIPDKLLSILRKYPYNWRLSQLARPKWRTRKFVPKVVEPIRTPRKEAPKLTNKIKFYSDQIARPLIRTLVVNKGLWQKQNGRKYTRVMNKYITKSWASIYNFYRKKEIDRKKRLQLRNAMKKDDKKTKKVKDTDRIVKLARPKTIFYPPPIPKSKKIFKDFEYIEALAVPKKRQDPPERNQQVSPAALTYELTENMLKLAALPERFKLILPPVELGKVVKSALRFKITPRLETLAVPKQRKEKASEDEGFDPWAISRTALKYKPTARILELSKPLERT